MKATPVNDPRPYEFETASSQEFFDLCERQRKGEFIIREMHVGKTPGRWVIYVRYEKPYSPQGDLFQ